MRRTTIVRGRELGGQYNGYNWSLNGRQYFSVEVPDPGGGEPGHQDFETYAALTDWVDREIAARAKQSYVTSLPVVYLGEHSRPGLHEAVVSGINRTQSKLSAKGVGALAGYSVLPDTPSMRDLVERYLGAERHFRRVEKLMEPFKIEARRKAPGRSYGSIPPELYAATVQELEAEYDEKHRAAMEFDPGYELKALEEAELKGNDQ